jgi:hypothetical protein
MLTVSQSRAGKGNKDIIVTYNDGDATPDGHPRPSLIAQGVGASVKSKMPASHDDLSAA